MRKDNRANILFRYGLIAMVILAFSFRIVAKLVDTTLISADEWNEKAMKELSRTRPIPPERGNILAADGSILATNLQYYTVRIDFRSERFQTERYIKAVDSIADSMARYFPQRNRDQWARHLLKPLSVPKKERSRTFTVITNINYAQYQKLRTFPFFNIKNPNKNGLVPDTYMRRVRPYGNMARRSIGGVGVTKGREVHGISGLECALDTLLYGIPGVSKKVPMTRDMVNWTDIPAIPGYDIQTTIDIKLQDIVENELNRQLEWCDADWGVAVLMDVKTGDIRAISNLEKAVSTPGYIEGMNRAVLGFEPGSVMKTLSMMIALEDGIVRPGDYIPTGSGYAYAGGRPITDSHGVDGMTAAEVIERSSNIGMTKIIARKYDANPGGFYHRLRQIGFMEPMHTGITGERPPRIDSVPDDRGGRIALSRQCYGYATEIPPLYTLSIYNAIANGGRYVRPRLVSRLIGGETDSVLPVTYIRDRICSEQNARRLREMLTSVVWGDHGTGRRLRNDLVKIAGKTGTCYMIDGGSYNTSKKRLAFCGFFPADNPVYSCIVLIANPKANAFGAASTSGEVLKNVAVKLYSRGLLGNSSDYTKEDRRGGQNAPTYIASVNDPSMAGDLQSALGVGGGHKSLRAPRSSGENARRRTVPDVTGLSLREAVNRLENAGYNVRVSGAGWVRRQQPSGGTVASRGTRVTLTTSN